MAVISVGLDVVDVQRARGMIERLGERIMRRTMTPLEREYIASLGDPVPAFAARLAAKEAVYKALQPLPGSRPISWQEIEVCRLPDGRPEIALSGRALEVLEPHRVTIHLSISHSRFVAAAVAILEG